MSVRTKYYLVCDGCNRDGLHHDIEIVHSQKSRPLDKEVDIHLCAECYDSGKYYCTRCHKVHDDANLCDQIKQEIEDNDRYLREVYEREAAKPFDPATLNLPTF